jgi:isopentenyl-diphosphate delta-isomerase
VSDQRISERKTQHIDIACNEDVTFKTNGTLLDGVRLVHEALPDLSLDEIDTRTELLGKTLRAPIVIAGMTGGSPRSRSINRELAILAQERGYGFGLGSQRPMVQRAELLDSYAVRDVAPDVLLLGNIGVIQAHKLSTGVLSKMVADVGADALCVHMNPAMEVVQPEGDRDFRGGLETMKRLAAELDVPVVAKETGCGISHATALRLKSVGVNAVDVSGAGGTSWVAVETKRAEGSGRALGELFREWGIPTAASVMMTRAAGMQSVIATGGIETGLDIARSIVIGASAGGMARVVLQALEHGGRAEAGALLDRVETELKTTMLLVGARNIDSLRRVPRTLSSALSAWAELAAGVGIRA